MQTKLDFVEFNSLSMVTCFVEGTVYGLQIFEIKLWNLNLLNITHPRLPYFENKSFMSYGASSYVWEARAKPMKTVNIILDSKFTYLLLRLAGLKLFLLSSRCVHLCMAGGRSNSNCRESVINYAENQTTLLLSFKE